MRLEVTLTKREAESLRKHTHYLVSDGNGGLVEEALPSIDWPHGTRKSQARQSAERKLLAALAPSSVSPVHDHEEET